MVAPSEAQIGYALKLGIANPQGFDRKELSKQIDAKKNAFSKQAEVVAPKAEKILPGPSNAVLGTTEGISQVNHTFQSEYEFGPASNRHRVKYNKIIDLQIRMKELKDLGYLEEGFVDPKA